MEPKSTTNETNLAQGGGERVPENRHTYEKVKKGAKVKNQNKKKRMFLNVGRFSQKTKSSTAGRLLWYYQQL